MKIINKNFKSLVVVCMLSFAFYACDSDSFTSSFSPQAPRATFSTMPGTFVAPGTPVVFSDNSTNTPTSWLWDMPGATPSTSTEQNPSVIYEFESEEDKPFPVTLTVTNSSGTSTTFYEDYMRISVLAIPEEVLLNFENNLVNEGAEQIDASLNPVAVGVEQYGTSHDGSGASYVFDGTNSLHIEGYKAISGSNPRTIALWTKTPVTVNGPKGLVSWGANATGTRYSFKREVSGVVRIEWQGGGLNGITPINDNNWHHVAVTWDESTIILYVDGVEDAKANPTIINTGMNFDLEVGTYRRNPGFTYVGEMDDIRIDNEAYTPEKIKAIFEGTE